MGLVVFGEVEAAFEVFAEGFKLGVGDGVGVGLVWEGIMPGFFILAWVG